MSPKRGARIWDVLLENSAAATSYVFPQLKCATVITTVKTAAMKSRPFAPHKDFAFLISSDVEVVIVLTKRWPVTPSTIALMARTKLIAAIRPFAALERARNCASRKRMERTVAIVHLVILLLEPANQRLV